VGKQHYGRELWERMGEFVDAADNLPVYDCGPWTIRKLFFLCQYVAQVTTAMVGSRFFSSANYIDLFASSGVCRVTAESGRQQLYPGSALLAAGCKKPFDNIFVVEKEADLLSALQQRIKRLETSSRVQAWNGDANVLIDKVAAAIPDRALNVAFIDPYSLDIHFKTISTLAKARPMDLLILFADAMDIARNVDEYYYSRHSDKLDLLLGERSNWRQGWEKLHNRDGGNLRQFFAEVYLSQLKLLGYSFSRTLPINSDHGPLYRLVFASKHERGLKFWDISANEDLEGNKGLFGI